MNTSDAHYRMILNAIPIPAFVVGEDVEILDLNGAAAQFCNKNSEEVYRRRGGEVLHCLHSTDVPEGCGRGPHCSSCVIRNSVAELSGRAKGQPYDNEYTTGSRRAAKDSQVLITASSMPDCGDKLALVMVEDVTERQKEVYNISPSNSLRNSPMPRQQIDWHLSPGPSESFRHTLTLDSGNWTLIER